MTIEFSTTGFCPPFDGGNVARTSEELGFDIQLFGDNHNSSADVFGEMRIAAAATSRIKLMCGIVNFVTRDPGVVATSIAPVQIVSRGRAICGVGKGDSAVGLSGKKPQRHAEFTRDLDHLQTWLGGGTVTFGDRESRLAWLERHPLPHPYVKVPVEMVCSGPKSIALAASMADRIGLSVGANPERIRWAMNIIDASLSIAGRSRSDVRVGAYVSTALHNDRASALNMLRSRCAGWAHMSSFATNDLVNQPPIMRRVTEHLRTSYDYRFHRPDVPLDNPNNQIIDDEFAAWWGLAGSGAELVDRFGGLVELGIECFGITLHGEEREQFAASVMPTVKRMS